MESIFLCQDCSIQLTTIEGEYDVYAYCSKCFKFYGSISYDSRSLDQCCKTPNQVFVKYQIRGGSFQLRKQCKSCAVMPTRSYSQKEIDIHSFPWADLEAEKLIQKFRDNERTQKQQEVRRMYLEIFDDLVEYIESKYKGYKEYLKSPQWKQKRKIVLQRDNFVCQSCLCSPATEVHHLTYAHIMNEPLFDLKSVCRDCHEKITQMDRHQSDVGKIGHVE